MKKILSIACLMLLVLSFKVNAQSNLTWVVKDKLEDNSIKTKLEFHISIVGLANENEATAFCDKMRANQDVESCQNTGKDNTGAYSVTLKMKKVSEAEYYIAWAQKLGVSFIEAKGEKKTPTEWIRASRK